MTTRINSILKAARIHCERVIRPSVDSWNTMAQWPRASSNKAAAAGLTGLYCPKELGGQGLSLEEGIQVYEELGKGDGAYAFALSMHNICSYAVCNFANESFKEKWAKDLTSGRKLANFALTEPQSGSDPVAMFTKATLNKDDSFIINGSKAWVSLAGEADFYLVVAKTSDKAGYKDMVMLAVPKDTKGLSFGPLYKTPSYRFLPMSEMYLDKVEVPAENLILPVGKAFGASLMAIDIARVSIASGCCGLMQSALDIALRYTKNRKMFSTTNLKLDGIQWMLGEVATDLEISRLLYRKATSDKAGYKDMVMLAVPKDTKGLSFGPLYKTPSYRFLPMSEMYLDKVEVPAENLILPVGKAFGLND